MKTATEFGPWTMSAHDCRMNSFWKRRFDALQCSTAKGSSRRHWISLLMLLTLMVGMPAWQLGEQTATAQEQPTIAGELVPPRPVSVDVGTARRSKFLAGPNVLENNSPGPIPKSARPWQLVDSPQLPASDKIVLMEGQELNLDMPKGGTLSRTDSSTDIFSVAADEATGDLLIRGLKSGVGSLMFEQGERKQVDFKVVVVTDPARLKTKLDKVGLGRIKVTPGVQSVTLSGNVKTPSELKCCIAMADELYPHVVNNIHIRNPQQVQLSCQVFEFKTTEDKLDGVLDQLFRNGKPESHDTGIYSSLLDGKAFTTTFEELRKTVQVKMLAEPVLTTVSGRPTAFQAGGEFPILIPQGADTFSVEYKQFGTRVDCVPTVLEDGRIHLELRPQVSSIMHDKEYAFTLNDLSIPALKQRWVDVAVEMNAKQTMVTVLVHKNEKGGKTGFVTMVRPSLVAATDPFVGQIHELRPLRFVR